MWYDAFMKLMDMVKKLKNKAAGAAEGLVEKVGKEALKDGKSKAAAGMLVAAVFAAITASTVFDSPSEIVSKEDISPTPIAETISMNDILSTAEEAEKHKPRKKKLSSVIKEKLQELPAAVRITVVLPLYILGTLLTKLLGALFTGVMAPVLAAVLKWAVLALVLWLAAGLILKAIFPDIPLSKLLTLKNLLYCFIGVVCLALLDKCMPLIFSDYKKWMDAFKFTVGIIILISVTVPAATAIIKHRRDKKMALEA